MGGLAVVDGGRFVKGLETHNYVCECTCDSLLLKLGSHRRGIEVPHRVYASALLTPEGRFRIKREIETTRYQGGTGGTQGNSWISSCSPIATATTSYARSYSVFGR